MRRKDQEVNSQRSDRIKTLLDFPTRLRYAAGDCRYHSTALLSVGSNRECCHCASNHNAQSRVMCSPNTIVRCTARPMILHNLAKFRSSPPTHMAISRHTYQALLSLLSTNRMAAHVCIFSCILSYRQISQVPNRRVNNIVNYRNLSA